MFFFFIIPFYFKAIHYKFHQKRTTGMTTAFGFGELLIMHDDWDLEGWRRGAQNGRGKQSRRVELHHHAEGSRPPRRRWEAAHVSLSPGRFGSSMHFRIRIRRVCVSTGQGGGPGTACFRGWAYSPLSFYPPTRAFLSEDEKIGSLPAEVLFLVAFTRTFLLCVKNTPLLLMRLSWCSYTGFVLLWF